MAAPDKRQHLISVATRLFERFGYFGTGIDQIVEGSGVAKTTLYRHFPSKEDLIVAVLTDVDARYRENLARAAEVHADDPEQELLAAFDFLGKWISAPNFNGCIFVGATSEFGERGEQICHAAAHHKSEMRRYFERLLKAAGYIDVERIAEEVQILHEGAVAVAHVSGGGSTATNAKTMVQKILSVERKCR